MPRLKQNQPTETDALDMRWTGLFKAGGAAALIMLVLMITQIVVFAVWPPPTTADGFYELFDKSWILGLLSLDFLYIVDSILLVLIYLAVYASLKHIDESSMIIALVLGLTGIAAYFASNTAFEMLSLSSQYAAALSDTQRATLLITGQAMLETYKGTAFNIYYVLNTIVLFIFSYVMLRCSIFSKTTAYLGLLAGILMIVPSTAGVLDCTFHLHRLYPGHFGWSWQAEGCFSWVLGIKVPFKKEQA